MSADVMAVNGALKAGSKAENLATGPSALFMEPPTPGGIENARRLLSEEVAAKTKKPWWRFW
jgi:hypothetical protein